MFFVGVRVHQEVVDVNDDVLQVSDYSFYKLLERGRASQKSHGGSDSMELTLALNCKGSLRL
jgi:hypothetical protein